ncbi:MAG: UDP-2,3-diacylglucosamine pyrophosphatase [Rickettsiales bacterium]|nr:UDP-2,3-diacylglucosamine pyrophosphatase [Rickettsiales bacterium]
MEAQATASGSDKPKLGIIAGKGELPRRIIQNCMRRGRPFFVVALEGAADEETVEHISHAWVRLGAIGKAIQLLRDEGAEELVLAGKVTRPKLSNLRPDLKATKLLARLGSNLFTGDDELLRGIITFLEEEGFKVVGADEVVDDILTPEGLIGGLYPDKKAQADIEFGAQIAKGIGELDIGQSVVVQNHQVLGVEAVEGTDNLIKRCADLKVEERGGVLVKVKKPNQEKRVDLPTIGINTVENVAKAGLAGIAAEAGGSLMIDRREIAKRADELGIFVVGFSVE